MQADAVRKFRTRRSSTREGWREYAPRLTARSGEHRLPGGGRAAGSGTRISRGASPRVNAMEMRSNHRACWALVASREIREATGEKGEVGRTGEFVGKEKKHAADEIMGNHRIAYTGIYNNEY